MMSSCRSDRLPSAAVGSLAAMAMTTMAATARPRLIAASAAPERA